MDILLTIILGSFVGVSAALLGLGGNILIVPILPMISDLQLPSVIATGIFTVFIVTLINVFNFYRQNLIDISLILLLFIPTSVASYTSSHFAHLVPESILKILFLLVMAIMLVRLFLTSKAKNQEARKFPKLVLLISGAFSGILAGLTGVGTGIILAPLLLSMSVTDERKVSPTINFLIMVSCFFSSLNCLSFENLSFPQSGLVRLDYALYIAIPASITAIVGRKMNSNISTKHRRIVVGLALSLLMIKTII